MGLQAGGMVVFDGYANHRIYARTAYRILMIFSMRVLPVCSVAGMLATRGAGPDVV